jgi:hypothetical protein
MALLFSIFLMKYLLSNTSAISIANGNNFCKKREYSVKNMDIVKLPVDPLTKANQQALDILYEC